MPDASTNPSLALRLNKLSLVGNPPNSSAAEATVTLLTRGLAAGQEEAFREFHRLYFDRLYHFLLAVTRGQELEAREALQETFLRLLHHPRVFTNEEVFWCWLKAVARNAARDAHRKHRRYFALLQSFALGLARVGPEPPGSDDTRLAVLLEESLEELPAEDRQLVENKYLDGETVRELSTLAGSSEKALESRLLRLRRQLRARILDKLQLP